MGKFKLYACTVLGTILTAYGLMGCGKLMDCDIDYDHAHAYSGTNGITKYIKSEREKMSGLSWTDKTKSLNPTDEKLLKFLNNNNLYSISDNKEYLEYIMQSNQPHVEYEYSYLAEEVDYYIDGRNFTYTYSPIGSRTTYDADGDPQTEFYPNIAVYKTVPKTDFTPNSDHEDLTGNIRDVSYKYTTYKVVMDYNGKYTIEKSPSMDELDRLDYTYKYFKVEDLITPIYGDPYEMNIKVKKQ